MIPNPSWQVQILNSKKMRSETMEYGKLKLNIYLVLLTTCLALANAPLIAETKSDIATLCDRGTLALQLAWERGHDLSEEEFKTRLQYDRIEAGAVSNDVEAITSMMDSYGIHSTETAKMMVAAASAGHSETVMTMIEAGASPDGDGSRYVPLMSASQCSRQEVASLLLGAGADVHAQGLQGQDSMMVAIGHSNYEVARLISSFGYDPCRNQREDGRSVYQLLEGVGKEPAEFGMQSVSCD